MNCNAAALKMTNTNFDSPHGLQNITNVSTAYDMARLASKCMLIPAFRRIVNTKIYDCKPMKEVPKLVSAADKKKLLPKRKTNHVSTAASGSEDSSEFHGS